MKSSDPAEPANVNGNHTTTSGTKPTTAFTAITDPNFLPTLDNAPIEQHAKSHLLLLSMVLGAGLLAYLGGFELLQVSEQSSWQDVGLGAGAAVLLVLAGLYWTGAHYIDWWELVSGYWWLSMPVAGAAGLLLVMAQEKSLGWDEVD